MVWLLYYTEHLSLLIIAGAQLRVTPGCPAGIWIGDLSCAGRLLTTELTPHLKSSTTTELLGTSNHWATLNHTATELRHTLATELRHALLSYATLQRLSYATPRWATALQTESTPQAELRCNPGSATPPHPMSFATTPILYRGQHRCMIFGLYE